QPETLRPGEIGMLAEEAARDADLLGSRLLDLLPHPVPGLAPRLGIGEVLRELAVQGVAEREAALGRRAVEPLLRRLGAPRLAIRRVRVAPLLGELERGEPVAAPRLVALQPAADLLRVGALGPPRQVGARAARDRALALRRMGPGELHQPQRG